MSREIKFRAWSKETGKMSNWDFINSVRNLQKLMTLNHIELMQYTGLRDSKRTDEYPEGQEIYEGDITSFIGRSVKYIIVFENGAYYLYHTIQKDFEGNALKWGLLSRAFEIENLGTPVVIGNIHENPELLK